MTAEARLDEFDQDEWWDVCRELCPDWTRERFDKAWAEFAREKQRRAMQ